MVEPVHPLDGSELHRLGMAPGTTPADHLGLEELDAGQEQPREGAFQGSLKVFGASGVWI